MDNYSNPSRISPSLFYFTLAVGFAFYVATEFYYCYEKDTVHKSQNIEQSYLESLVQDH